MDRTGARVPTDRRDDRLLQGVLVRAIALVNQTAAPALQHGYGMAAVNDNTFIAPYTKTMTNFGAAYAATQDTMKSQAASLAAMQSQLANIQQFCMAVGQQPPSTVYQPPSNNYAPTQQQRRTYNRGGRGGGQGGGGHGGGNQQPTWYDFWRSRRTAITCAHPLQAVRKLELLFLAWE